MAKLNRNDHCSCGSGLKYKKCCQIKHEQASKMAKEISVNLEQQFQTALAHHRRGERDQAQQLYQQILQLQPNHADALHLLGVIANERGNNQQAIKLIQQAIQFQPNKAFYYNNLANAFQAMGDYATAIKHYQQSLVLNPKDAQTYNNLANSLQAWGKIDDAIKQYKQALILKKDYAQAYFNLGNTYCYLKQWQLASDYYQQAINFQPNYASAFSNLGVCFKELNQLEKAIKCYQQALQLNPNLADAYSNWGVALQAQGYYQAAVNCYQQALQLKPDAITYNNLGISQKDQGELAAAIDSYQQALLLKPNYAEALNNLGVVFQLQGQNEVALNYYQQALNLKPNDADTHNNVGNLFKGLRQYESAIEAYRNALNCQNDYTIAFDNLFKTLLDCCVWHNYDINYQRFIDNVKLSDPNCNPFNFLSICDSVELQQRCAYTYTKQKHPLIDSPLWQGEPYSHSKIRLAYISADFRDHPVSYLATQLFEIHNRQRFEVIGISLRAEDKSPIGQRVKNAFDQFIIVADYSDKQIAELIKQLEIDIAVDLMGITQHSRTSIFAYKPAPIQVNYLGYPGTMATEYIDYLIADAWVIPPHHQIFYQEKIVYLPSCYLVTDDRCEIAKSIPSRRELNLPENGFVFCCFNNSYKLTPTIFNIWLTILKQIENSVLWLPKTNSLAMKNLIEIAQQQGVNSQRLIFATYTETTAEHLARLSQADLFLDTQPYNAHTTAIDALWAGVPVLTCNGNAFAGRVAASLLNSLQLAELITEDLTSYQQLAIQLATEPDLLQSIRQKLQIQRQISPVFNTQQFAHHLETAYSTMWQRYQQQLPAESFAV
ncbi:MAG: hypothetical protein RL637_18 [Pseudomonadota bacterium]